jgi:predicted transposase/invertase (TIGR01784 family)
MLFSKFLDPKNDVAFRKIFGTEKNKDILIHFLNDIITFNNHLKIVDVSFLKTIQDPETASKKSSIVDIFCKDQKGNSYIVEMQIAKEKGFAKRAQYYASKAYVSQACAGGKYHNLKEIIFLAISDFVMFPKKKRFKSDHVILDNESHENDLKDFYFTFLELPKFKKSIDELENMVDKWCYFFKNAEKTSDEELHKIIGQDPIIERAYHELDRFGWTDEELHTYDQAEKHAGALLAALEQKFDEGKTEGEKIGIEKGEKIGIEKGERIGIEKGEKKNQILTAKKCLAMNVDIKLIQEITGLSKKEIEKLKKEIM